MYAFIIKELGSVLKTETQSAQHISIKNRVGTGYDIGRGVIVLTYLEANVTSEIQKGATRYVQMKINA